MKKYNPCIYILSYNSEEVTTYNTLKKMGNTIPTKIIVGTDDPILDNYKQKYNEELLIFNKENISVDLMNNFHEKKFPIFAREYAYIHAKKNNITHYVLLEDDYESFMIRYVENGKLKKTSCNINDWFHFLLHLTDKIGDKIAISISQGGDYIGGVDASIIKKGYKFKLMNSYFINIKYPYHFVGSINDDVNTAISLPTRYGKIPVTIPGLMLNQEETQGENTALRDIYLKYSTYTKSMYSIIINPSAVKIMMMGVAHKRIHHKTMTNLLYPKILSEKYKKTT